MMGFKPGDFEAYNIFEHGRFFEAVSKQLKACDTKEEFADKLGSELMYYFWSKCAYEVLLEEKDDRIVMKTWAGYKDFELDVTDNQDFDWRRFYKEKRKEQTGECIKIDVYDQVMYRYDEFVETLQVDFSSISNEIEKVYDENGEVCAFFNVMVYRTAFENIFLVSSENFDNRDNDYIQYRLLFVKNCSEQI